MSAPAIPTAPFQHDLATLPLTSTGPRAGAISGEPEEFAHELYSDGAVEIGVWECTPGVFPTVKDGISESMQILAGAGTLRGEDGTEIRLEPGMVLITPDGWRGTWEITETVRKVYTIWNTAK
jgi:uncharacterized cupin superfamily protein